MTIDRVPGCAGDRVKLRYLTDAALDLAILKTLYPENRTSEIQLSVDIANSGGATRTTLRCFDLQDRGLIFCTYTGTGNGVSVWKLTVRGRLEVQSLAGQEAGAIGGKQ